MMPKAKAAASQPFSVPEWTARLRAEDSLTPGLRGSYRQTLARFGEFCRQRRTGPSVAGAREFVELARLERAPSPARLQEWKDALNWFFRGGREAAVVALRGVPPLARSDLGTAPWEAALIAHLRQQQRSWRTEQTLCLVESRGLRDGQGRSRECEFAEGWRERDWLPALTRRGYQSACSRTS